MISAKAIKTARMAAGLSQAELAERLDVAAGTVAGWELGTHTPRWESLRKLAKVTGVEVSELLA